MRRVLVVVVAVAVLVVAVIFFGLRTLESAKGAARIASALSNMLGERVTIGGLNVSLLPSPALDARDIRIGEGDQTAAPGVSLSGLHVVPELFSFLPGRTPVVDRIDLVGLAVSVRRDKTGKWLLPVPAGASSAAPSAAGGKGAAPSAAASSPSASSASPSSASPSSASSSSASSSAAASSSASSSAGGAGIDIKDLRVTGGSIRVVDDSLLTASGASTVTQITGIEAQLQAAGTAITVPNFSGKLGQTALTGDAKSGPEGVMLHLSVPSVANADLPSLFALAGMAPMAGLSIGGLSPVDVTTTIGADMQTFTVNGTAGFEKLALNSITLTHVKSPFKFVKKIFTLDPMAFDLYGGHETGTVAVDMNKTPMAFSIKTTITGLDVNQALSATTTMKDKLTGTGKFTVNVRGSGTSQPAIEKTLAGTVGFAVTNGVLHNFPLMASINSALGAIGQGGSSPQLTFQSFSGTAAIANGKATTNDLALKSDVVTLNGGGTYGFDQSVAFKLKAGLSSSASSQIASKVSFASRLEDSQGQITVPVNVSGTASSPKFAVDVKSAATQQVKGLLNQFLKKP
jgi:uncharacterized protein involved in outer membrane biogenesis